MAERQRRCVLEMSELFCSSFTVLSGPLPTILVLSSRTNSVSLVNDTATLISKKTKSVREVNRTISAEITGSNVLMKVIFSIKGKMVRGDQLRAQSILVLDIITNT